MKADLGYTEAFMILIGVESEVEKWLTKARAFRSDNGQEIRFIAYDPTDSERVAREETMRVDVPEK